MSHLRRIAGYTGIMILLTLLLKPLGIIKDMMVANYFGVSSGLGSFFLFQGIATFFAAMVYAMYAGTVTPVYIRLVREKKDHDAISLMLTSGVFYFGLILIFCVLVLNFSQPIITAFAPGMAGEEARHIAQYAPWLALVLFCMATSQFFSSLLEAEQRYVVSRLAQACVSFSLIGAVGFYNERGWSVLFPGLALGYALCGGIQAVQFFWIKRFLPWRLNFFNKELHRILRRWLAVGCGASVSSSSLIVDRMMISLLGTQGLAVFGYAETLSSNISGLILTSLSTAVLPVFSNLSGTDRKQLPETLFNTFCYISALLLPLVVAITVYGDLIIDLLYARGKFQSGDSAAVAQVLGFLVLTMVPLAGIMLWSRVFDVLLDVRSNLLGAIVNAVLNIVLDYLLMQRYGVAGIALATLAVNTAVWWLFVVTLSIKHGMTPSRIYIFRFLGLAAGAAWAGFAAYKSRTLGLEVSIGFFVGVYLIAILLLQLQEYLTFLSTGLSWIRRRVVA